MAVEPKCNGCGLGSQVLIGLENVARELGAIDVVLNSRESARPFYERHGYAAIGRADTIFGEIAHVRMQRRIVDDP